MARASSASIRTRAHARSCGRLRRGGRPSRRQGATTLILNVLIAIALLGTITHTAASEAALDLNGVWQLERKQGFEAYLKASGAPWWKRKLAQLAGSRMRQTIKHEGNRFEITSKSRLETRSEEFVADGVTERSTKAASGDWMTWKARVEGAAFVLDGHGDLGHRIIRREIADGMMVMTIFNPDADAHCKLFFERVQAD